MISQAIKQLRKRTCMSLARVKIPSVVERCSSRAKHSVNAKRKGGESVSFLACSTAVAPCLYVKEMNGLIDRNEKKD